MKTGDLVHVPANVTLHRVALFDVGIEGIKHFVTNVPKKALFLEHGPLDYCFVKYGDHAWNVRKRDITLVEYKNDS